MNPYLATGLAMCGIVVIALAATAYMAVIFNRRAKADLERALMPLTSVIDGDVNLDDAKVSGRFAGHIAEGRMSTSLTGPGRVFHISVIDGAGGTTWKWSSSRARRAGEEPETEFASPDGDLDSRLRSALQATFSSMSDRSSWTVVEYDPVPGYIRLTRPMQTRHDIPNTEQFESDLKALVAIAAHNRAVQYVED